MDKQTAKIITLLTDTIVAATVAIDRATEEENPTGIEEAIKSAYYGLDNALTLTRRRMGGPAPAPAPLGRVVPLPRRE